ncbi:MAG: alpha-2-macroglobulin [Leptospiraceae bacterium]|nr:alpha-2-macroglobulin [Leptospiraceae bacterium]
MKYFFFIFFLLSLFVTSVFSEEAKINSFSPQNEVKNVKQVKVLFSSQMVEFGDPRANTDIFDIDCAFQGKARWIDERTYVYEFEESMSAGYTCSFALKPTVKNLKGAFITGEKRYSFTTGGPSITNTHPYEGSYVDEDQIFLLELDGKAKIDSVSSNVYFSIEGIQEKVGAQIIPPSEIAQILKNQFHNNIPNNLVALKSKQHFPSNSKISLVWSKGIESETGIPTSKDQILEFRSREPFTASFSCERENKKAGCIPLLNMNLYFSAQISKSYSKQIFIKSGKHTWKPNLDSNESEESQYVSFQGPFPENTTMYLHIPNGIKDDSGRSLVNAKRFPLKIKTDRYPPLAKFAAKFGILEWKAEPALPITVRNIEVPMKTNMTYFEKGRELGLVGNFIGKRARISGENILHWLKKLYNSTDSKSVFKGESATVQSLSIPRNKKESFEVIGIPLKEPGFYVVEVQSKILGKSILNKNTSMYIPAAALVTNLSVHFKWGRENTLVWVTTLSNGQPVRNANIKVMDCKGDIIAKGKTDNFGIAYPGKIDRDRVKNCSWETYNNGVLVIAEKDNDLSFVHSSWDNGIENWRFNLTSSGNYLPYYYGQKNDSLIAHSILDRTLFRAGETVSMKHIIRRHTMKGMNFPNKNKLPNKLKISHSGSGQEFVLPLSWDSSGISESTWKIPKEAKLGFYNLTMYNGSKNSSTMSTASFRVEEFKVPLMKGIIKPPGKKLVNPTSIPLDLSVRYLSGGGASNLPIKLKSWFRAGGQPHFNDYSEYVFANGKLSLGIKKHSQNYWDNEDSSATNNDMRSDEFSLDGTGSIHTDIGNVPKKDTMQTLVTELEYKDPNGEMQTISQRTNIYSSEFFVGLKEDSWVSSKDALKINAIVVDLQGKPVAYHNVEIEVLERKYYSHRKRLVGGFYSYENYEEVKNVGNFCQGKTDRKGMLICEKKAPITGNVILQAFITDNKGNKVYSNREIYVPGSDNDWYTSTDNDRMDILPDKKQYEPGETAKFQIRAPFRTARALVTIEREGVIEAYVRGVTGSIPVIRVPIKNNYAPNVYVSILAVRGRVGKVKPTAMVDLGRPSYRLGLANIRVGWKAHELDVKLEANKKIYKVRDKADITIQVKTVNGKSLPSGSEVALAAVDEGLLELMPNSTWNLLASMMGLRRLEVDTATAQMQVIGKRHFGLKAMPQGGGGGNQTTRELFDTLLYWKGRVKLDKYGKAKIQIPLNDSLTSFKIVAIANSGRGYFGTGNTSIQTTQDLMLFSGIAPLAREGDQYLPEVTIRNSSEKELQTKLSINIDGLNQKLSHQNIKLKPSESKEVFWDIKIPFGVDKLVYTIEATGTNNAKDKIKIEQKIIPPLPVNTVQGTLVQLEKEHSLMVKRPDNSQEGRGGIYLNYSSTLVNGLDSVKEYMSKYPYSCLEQKVSKAIALRDAEHWDRIAANMITYLDYNGLAKYFPTTHLEGSPTLTSYILSISHEADYEIPKDTLNLMLGGLTRFVKGEIDSPGALQTADLSIRKLKALEALSRYNQAKKEYLDSLNLSEANLFPTSALVDYWNILYRVKDISNRAKELEHVEQILRSRISLQGSVMRFTTAKKDNLWWLMVSEDYNAIQLLLSIVKMDKWKEDVPRIVTGILGRLKIREGNWDLTTANAWGVLAIEKFSQKFEKDKVSGKTTSSFNKDKKTLEWDNSSKKEQSFPWGAGPTELKLSHIGQGKPWVNIQSRAAIRLTQPVSNGFTIQKTITPIEQKNPGKWSIGDIMRIRLKVKADMGMTWVVITDPIPTGTSILGSGLGRDSASATSGEKETGYTYPAFVERSYESYRAYYNYVSEGEWTMEYTIRLNQSGKFQLPQSRVEAMYSPDMYGEFPNDTIEIVR